MNRMQPEPEFGDDLKVTASAAYSPKEVFVFFGVSIHSWFFKLKKQE